MIQLLINSQLDEHFNKHVNFQFLNAEIIKYFELELELKLEHAKGNDSVTH